MWVADEQTAGRGRGGHRWHSAAGDGLYVSALVSAGAADDDGALDCRWRRGWRRQAAIAEVTGLRVDIRWPNDLLVNGKKCGGILVETAMTPAQGATAMLRYAVIGVGINLNHESFPEELEALATSLRTGERCAWCRERRCSRRCCARWMKRFGC